MINLESEKLIFTAGTLLRDSQAGEAASVLQDCLLRYPDSGKAHALMGYIYHRFFHEPHLAEDHFKKAMILNADFPLTYIYYAEALFAQERFTEMTAMLNKGLETTAAPKNEIYNLFGRMNEMQARYEEAVDDYRKAIIFSDDDAAISSYTKNINRCRDKQKMYSGE